MCAFLSKSFSLCVGTDVCAKKMQSYPLSVYIASAKPNSLIHRLRAFGHCLSLYLTAQKYPKQWFWIKSWFVLAWAWTPKIGNMLAQKFVWNFHFVYDFVQQFHECFESKKRVKSPDCGQKCCSTSTNQLFLLLYFCFHYILFVSQLNKQPVGFIQIYMCYVVQLQIWMTRLIRSIEMTTFSFLNSSWWFILNADFVREFPQKDTFQHLSIA